VSDQRHFVALLYTLSRDTTEGFDSNLLILLSVKEDVISKGACADFFLTYLKKEEVMSVALRQPTLASAPSPSFCDGRKCAEVEQALLWTVLQQDLHCTTETCSPKRPNIRFGLG